MEFKQEVYIDIDKKKHKKKKVKAFIFMHSILDRELALHADIDNQNISAISDVLTGYRLCSIDKPCTNIQTTDILESMEDFIKHYTVELILNKFKEVEEELKQIESMKNE